MSQELSNHHQEAFLPRLTLILAKIAEVMHWCLAGIMLIGAICAMFGGSGFADWVKTTFLGTETNLSCYGYEIAVVNAEGQINSGLIVTFAIGSVIVLSLMAMIFRNVYLILKTAQGKTWFAKGDTPFQANIVRMFREIGIFFISISVMTLIAEIIVNFTGGELSSGFNYLDCFIGLVFLCVSQFFNYGTCLERDVDGLV